MSFAVSGGLGSNMSVNVHAPNSSVTLIFDDGEGDPDKGVDTGRRGSTYEGAAEIVEPEPAGLIGSVRNG